MEHAAANTKQTSHADKAAPQRGSAQKPAPELHAALHLQKQAGNRAMQALLRGGLIRAKLAISQPDDPEEQEADAMAGRIMRSHAGETAAASSCSCSGDEEEMCDECRQKATGIARKATDGGAGRHPSHAAFSQMMRSSGHPLDVAARGFFEPRFGRDFSGVRVHTDASAAESAKSIHAHAFTAGSEIYFASGQYAPQSDEGRKLLAHELTHTLQQAHTGNARGLGTEERDGESGDARGTETAPDAERRMTNPTAMLSRQEDGKEGGNPDPAPTDEDLDAGTSPPSGGASGPSAGPLLFEGMSLTTDQQTTVNEVEKYVDEHGLEACQDLGPRFESELQLLHNNQQDVSGPPDPNDKERQRLTKMEEVAPLFRLVRPAVIEKSKEFLVEFEEEARKVARNMLAASQAQILSERERYGLTRTVTQKTVWKHDEGARYQETEVESSYGMASNSATSGMENAAKALADKARAVRSLMDARNDLMRVTSVPTEEEMAPYEAADKKVQAAAGEYNELRFKSDKDYPILAAFDELDTTSGTWSVDGTIDRLTGLADHSSKDTAGTLYDETAEKLANIDKVTHALATGDLRVWKLDPVVSLTLQKIDVLPAGMEKRLVDDKATETTPGEMLDIALGVLAIGLGVLAAIPTGGSSLAAGVAVAAGVGSAALGGYFAVEHIQQYSLEAAANGTDFDKAKAVSQVEPSLFWLAVDIIGALGGAAADIHAAAASFKTLSTTLREASELRQLAQEGQRVAEADAALARLKQEGEAVAPGLGEELTAKVGKEGTAVENEAALAAWEDSMNPESRAFLVDNPEVRAVYSDMDEEMRWLCTMCASKCPIENITRAQVARIRELANGMNKEQLDALRNYLHLKKADVDGAITEIEAEMAKRTFQERNPSVFESKGDPSFSKVDAPDVPEGQRLPRGTGTPDPELGGYWGGTTRGDGPYYSDIAEVNQVTGHRPIEFHDGFPDFSPWARERVRIPVTGNDSTDFALADQILAKQRGFKNQTAFKNWRSANKLTWHHVEGAEEMILVPTPLHENVPHVGGASQARTAAATPPVSTGP